VLVTVFTSSFHHIQLKRSSNPAFQLRALTINMTVPNDDFQPGPESYKGPSGTDTQQNDYTSRTGQKQAPVPVQNDQDEVEDPIDAKTADSDQQLGMLTQIPLIVYC
jgi:hypothetical protein